MAQKEHYFLLEMGSTTRGLVLLKLEGSAEKVSNSNDAHNINSFQLNYIPNYLFLIDKSLISSFWCPVFITEKNISSTIWRARYLS